MSSCAKERCKTSSDCLSKTCAISKCENKRCVYTAQKNCCGNQLKESIENGKPGNKCTCPADYGKCEGKGKVKIGARTEDATYVHYYCDDEEQCILGVEKKGAIPQNFLDSINTGFFKASSVVKFNKPFDVAKDAFEFKITLDDMRDELVLPVKFTKVKLLYVGGTSRTEQLIGEKNLEDLLNGIGDQVIISVPLTLNYRPQELEETGSLRYSFDYTFIKLVPSGKAPDGSVFYTEETARETYTAPKKQVFFFRSENAR